MDDACIGHHGVAILSCIQGFRHCDNESYAPLLQQTLQYNVILELCTTSQQTTEL
jgi:hypothetical protein